MFERTASLFLTIFILASSFIIHQATAAETLEVLVQGAPIHGTNGIMFDSDDQLYIASLNGREIVVMDPETGEILDKLGTDLGIEGPDDLTFGPDGSLYWTALLTGEVGRLSPDGVKTGQMVAPGVNPITFSDDGRLFVALDFLGDGLYELDPHLIEPPRLIVETLGFLNAFDFGPDGLLYGPIWTMGKVVRIDVDTGEMNQVTDGIGIPAAVKFNSQGQLHVLDHLSGEVIRVNIESGDKEVIAQLPPGLDNLAFDSQDRLFVSHTSDGSIFEVLPDGTIRTVSPGGMINPGGIAVITRPDGGESIFVADVNALREFDGLSGEELSVEHSWIGFPGSVMSPLTASPDGDDLVLSSWFANSVQVWDPETHTAVEEYLDFVVPLNAIRFQGDLVVAELGQEAGAARVVRASGLDPSDRVTLADAEDGLYVPSGLAATDDDLWVSDWVTGMVLQIVADGETLAEPVPVAMNLAFPEGMAVAWDGSLLVVETGAGRLSRIDRLTGEVSIVEEGLAVSFPGVEGLPPTWGFNGVAASMSGTIYIGSTDNQILTIPTTQEDANKAIANRIFSEIWNQGKLDIADEIFAADFARYDPGNPDLTGAVGPDGFKQLVSTYRVAFPDTHWTVDEMVAEGDLVATRWTSEGTHTGELMGMPATDLPVTVTGVSILRIADGKVVEEWVDWDSMGLMEQLGFAPATHQGYSWSDPSEVTGDPGDPEANKAVVMRYVEAWNQHNLDMVDEVMIADVIHHDPVLYPGESALEPHKQVVGMYFLAFPDLHSEVEVTLAEGDKVVMHGAVTGTHQGELMGIPATGRQVAWTWTTISRIADGKMVEMWWQYDVMGLMTQLTAQVIPDGLAVDEITSPSLTGNLLGDPDTREVIVYLPPSYATSDKRYPAVYLLHGYSGNARTFVSDAFTGLYWPADNDFPKDGLYGMLNDMIASEHLEEMIVIMPDASNTYGGSWYTNSELNGNYEDYIVNDLVSYIDNSYRTIPTRSGRAIVGHSMGGYGAMKLAMKHPDVFGAVGTLSGGISFEAMAASIPLVIAENPDGFIGPSPDKPFTSITYSMAAAFSPNLGNPPFFVDIPYEYPTGSLVYETWEKWMSHDVLTMLTPYAASLGSLRGIYVDSGDQDEFGTAPLAETAHQILDAVGIEHEYEIYSGTHFNRLFERLGIVLKFFSDTLVAEHKEGYTNVFFASLSSGLNMISLPLEPIEPYTARSFAEEIGTTTVIRYDESLGKFVGFTPAAPDDGFPIEGGKGYIVNVLGEGTVAFTGAAWTNEPPSDMAPPAQVNTAWAFVISGSVLDGDGMSAADECYTAIVKNLRTGDAFTESVESSGYFAAACADLSRKAVIGVGDQVEVAVIDSSGDLVSGPFIHDITMDSIRNAVMDVHLKLGDIIPAESSLLQNYPNPFNPETWIPYHLHDAETVIIRIYTATGQLIKTLDLGHKDAGIYASRSRAGYWDGRNEAGEIVASGIYFYTIQAGEYTATRKMTATK